MRTLDAMVDLRLASRRALGLLGDVKMARARLRAEWKRGIPSAREHGVLQTLPGRDGLDAAFVMLPHPMPHFCGMRVDLFLRGRDRRSRAWMRERIAEHAGALRGEVSVHLTRVDVALLPDLEKAGLHVSSIWLAGNPRRALARLLEKYGEPDWVGVECRPLETGRQIAKVIALTKDEFTRNPQFGEFVATKRFLAVISAELRADLEQGKRNHWVLVRKGELVGHFGVAHAPRTSFGSAVAAFGLTFHRDLQGKGLSKIAYRTMLEWMVERDVPLLMGVTSQPPVMHMGTVMGRPWIGYELRSGPGRLPREHFRYPRP